MPSVPTPAPGPLASTPSTDSDELLRQLLDQAHAACRASSTRRQYGYYWAGFVAFCTDAGSAALPADHQTVLRFLAWKSLTRKPVTLRNMRSAIRLHHEDAGHEDPTQHPDIRRFVQGHARLAGSLPQQKLPLTVEDIRRLCRHLDDEGGLAAIRDKAALLIGFAGALRASEAVNARIEHLQLSHKGLTMTLPRSKTDQEGKGQFIAVVRTAAPETCPVVALEEWLALLKTHGITQGYLLPAIQAAGDPALHQGRVVNRRLTTEGYRAMLKRRCQAIGLDPKLIGGHSLRSGHATQAAENGASMLEIAQQGRWTNLEQVQRYVRSGRRFQFNSSSRLGL